MYGCHKRHHPPSQPIARQKMLKRLTGRERKISHQPFPIQIPRSQYKAHGIPYLPSLTDPSAAHGTKRDEQYANTRAKVRHVKLHAVTRAKNTGSQRLQGIQDTITALCAQISRGARERSIGRVRFRECTTVHVEGLAVMFEITKRRGTHRGIFVKRGGHLTRLGGLQGLFHGFSRSWRVGGDIRDWE